MANFQVILKSLAPPITVGRLQGEFNRDQDCAVIHSRFPERDVALLNPHRKREHMAVHEALKHLPPPFNDAQIGHHFSGQPHFLSSVPSRISIAHHSQGDTCWVAVAVANEAIGCDIETPRDQLLNISHRFLNANELTRTDDNLQALSVAWTVKESMFKAFGPNMDFRNDMQIDWTGVEKALAEGIHGRARNETGTYRIWRIPADATVPQPELWVACGPWKADSQE